MDAQQPIGAGTDARGERHSGIDLSNTFANGSGQDDCLRFFLGGRRIFLKLTDGDLWEKTGSEWVTVKVKKGDDPGN